MLTPSTSADEFYIIELGDLIPLFIELINTYLNDSMSVEDYLENISSVKAISNTDLLALNLIDALDPLIIPAADIYTLLETSIEAILFKLRQLLGFSIDDFIIYGCLTPLTIIVSIIHVNKDLQ